MVALAAAALACWIVALPGFLSGASDTEMIGWVGLDVAELGALGAFLYAGVRRLAWVMQAAQLASALFVADAVIDVSTSTGSELPVAVAMALCAELPLAWLCLSEANRLTPALLRQRRLAQPSAAW